MPRFLVRDQIVVVNLIQTRHQKGSDAFDASSLPSINPAWTHWSHYTIQKDGFQLCRPKLRKPAISPLFRGASRSRAQAKVHAVEWYARMEAYKKVELKS
jgi:hypothetical protein